VSWRKGEAQKIVISMRNERKGDFSVLLATLGAGLLVTREVNASSQVTCQMLTGGRGGDTKAEGTMDRPVLLETQGGQVGDTSAGVWTSRMPRLCAGDITGVWNSQQALHG
jgi:hypothetical protein